MTDTITAFEPRRFEPDAPAAIDPRALGRRWASWREAARVRNAVGADGWPAPYGMIDSVAVVSVDGPLMQRGGYWWDGHDSVAERVRAALAEPRAKAVVLKINSPGGIAAGCFEAARQVRAAAQRSGKPVVAYADEMACSAAYALACACDKIYLPPSGEVGSVGVLSAVVSMQRSLDAEGIDFRVIRSGPKKALGHPADALSDAAVAAEQATVDALAAQFFSLVAESRRMTADAVAALEGDTRMGAAAVAAGLADGVLTFDEAVRAASSMPATPAPTTKGTSTMSDKLSAAVLALTGTTDEDAALGKLSAWKEAAARLPDAEARLSELNAAKADAEREAVIAGALDARKVTPARAAAIRAGTDPLCALPTKALAAHFGETPALVAHPNEGPRQPAQLPAAGAPEEVTLTEEDKRTAKSLRVTEADFLAQKRALAARNRAA
jgi:signal peptide peptidase SppA